MPRKRSQLARLTSRARARKKARAKETPEEAEARRLDQRLRQAARRAAETPEQAQDRREKKKQYRRTQRRNEAQKRRRKERECQLKAIQSDGKKKSNPRKTKRSNVHRTHVKSRREINGGGVNSGTGSRPKGRAHNLLEPKIEIKEEPMDYHPTQPTFTDTITNDDFTLPQQGNPSAVNLEVEPQFTLSVAILASNYTPETSDDPTVIEKET